MSYPNIVALDTDWTIWQGWLDYTRWGRGPGALALTEDNIEPQDRWTVRDRTNHNNTIRVFNDISSVVNDVLKNGSKLAIVSRNRSKAMCDRALYYFKAINPNHGNEWPISQLVQYNEVVDQSKTEHFRRIKALSGNDFAEMLLFDDEAYNNVVRIELGVTFQLARDKRGLMWDVYQQGLNAWRRVKNTTTIPSTPGFVPRRVRIGYSGLPQSWINLVRRGEGTVDPTTPYRWGYALYVSDKLGIAKYFCDWNNNWNSEKSYPCEVWVKDYDTWAKLNKIWIPENDGGIQQMNNLSWNAEQTGRNQEDRDRFIAENWGVQTPYVLFSQHHWMSGMPGPRERWTEMVIYTQVQRALFEVVPLSDFQVAQNRDPSPYPFPEQMKTWSITVPDKTKAEFRRYRETKLVQLATAANTVAPSNPGTPDIVAFGVYDVVTFRDITRPNPRVHTLVSNDLGLYAGNWQTSRHLRLVADLTGNKTSDIVGFGESAVLVSLNNGNNTFSPPRPVLYDFTYSSGNWRIENHIRLLADVRGTGRCDIVGFGDAGVLIAQNMGGGNFSPGYLALNDFDHNSGWVVYRHPRFLADFTGNGTLDIIGFGENCVFIALNKGNGYFHPAQGVINDFTPEAGGYFVSTHPRFVVDLTGDGKADVIGFGDAGVYVSLNDGTGLNFGPVHLVVPDFGAWQGWKVDNHPRFVVDLTGNKCGDVIGFGDAGVYVALNNGNGTFQPSRLVLRDFGVQQGWSVQKHLRFVVDLTGNGCADIVGFGDSAVLVALNDGRGNFGPIKTLNIGITFNGGWTLTNTVRCLANLG
ncbi:acid phosphatase-domain-containing protein [Crepidotus variabilis]|uniref:Acid phosphatase-domain-containing protein n=1 Tax=Crepidotus variabilis TaxID=179855 RepID=A0A9P6JKV4_9AGAR|nr:acid phosphatase-domain-containing protein [Crepidotus variabilis]